MKAFIAGNPGRFKIASQEHMADLWNMAGEIFDEEKAIH